MDFLEAVRAANKTIFLLLQSEGLNEYHHQSFAVGAGGDKSSGIDLAAEKIFIDYLQPFGTIISEESGILVNKQNNVQIILDPIDGSDNLLSHLPYYGTSVALRENGKCTKAIVTNLANGDIYIKENDGLQKGHLLSPLLAPVCINSFSKVGIFERSYCSTMVAKKLKQAGIKYRSPGAFALSLAYAHDVAFVLYEGVMRIYDVEAGMLMCEDLYTYKEDELFLVSKDKETFDKIIRLFTCKA
ncbi:MAG: inositol monophosphatase [Sulfurospirillaceae bacterium]|nr:inositol monophosphatase [Sulfurospirillaceae bacterium]MDD2827259.1 inositol monophosphatase [Sulfurospirillaceae bacterium]